MSGTGQRGPGFCLSFLAMYSSRTLLIASWRAGLVGFLLLGPVDHVLVESPGGFLPDWRNMVPRRVVDHSMSRSGVSERSISSSDIASKDSNSALCLLSSFAISFFVLGPFHSG